MNISGSIMTFPKILSKDVITDLSLLKLNALVYRNATRYVFVFYHSSSSLLSHYGAWHL